MTAPARSARTRSPRALLLALLGEYVLELHDTPVRAAVFIEVLENAGVQAPATRASLDRLEHTGILRRERRGREIAFSLTARGTSLLGEASARVRAPVPFHAEDGDWTLVTFTVPENQRTVRHRLRSSLTWEGFAPLRDGLWIAPGRVDLERALAPLRPELPSGAVTAFHAQELEGFALGVGIRSAWDLDAIRAEHLAFLDTWSASDALGARSALAARAMLVADWLALLRADPRLPREYLDAQWPAQASLDLYLRRREETAGAAAREFADYLPELARP